jgi:hypothetical protein
VSSALISSGQPALLEHDPVGAGVQHVAQLPRVGRRREDEQLRARLRLREPADQRVAATRRRQMQVDHRDVRRRRDDEVERRIGGARRPGHLPALLRQHVAQEHAQRAVIFDDRHPPR